MTFRSGATDSMPERIHVTQQIELRKKQQAEADRKLAQVQPVKVSKQ
jgi:hypothetical protein